MDRGLALPIPPSEFVAWKRAARVIVHPSEYAILSAMDTAWCAAMNDELQAFHARERERSMQDRKGG